MLDENGLVPVILNKTFEAGEIPERRKWRMVNKSPARTTLMLSPLIYLQIQKKNQREKQTRPTSMNDVPSANTLKHGRSTDAVRHPGLAYYYDKIYYYSLNYSNWTRLAKISELPFSSYQK